jgi:hypothetical protein
VRSLASEIEMIQGIVAPDTHHEITGIMGQPLMLRYDSQCSIAIHSQQGNAPIGCQLRFLLRADIRPTGDMRRMIDYRIARKHSVVHFLPPPSLASTYQQPVQRFHHTLPETIKPKHLLDGW